MNRSPTLEPGLELDVDIDALALGGDGVARVDGRVIFVPDAVPGDRVRVRIEQVAPRFLRAQVVALLTASADRRAPRCAHFGVCGGCALQTLAYPAQLEAKRRFVVDALSRIAGVVDAAVDVVSGPEYGYRTRAELRLVRSAAGGVRAGYLRRGSHEVELVSECPVLVPSLEAHVARFSREIVSVPRGAERVHLAAGEAGTAHCFTDVNERAVPRNERTPEIDVAIGDCRYRFGAGSFFQGNAALVTDLVELATGGAEGDTALDLYAGSGLFTLPLARAFADVLAVEADVDAVARARSNLAANALDARLFASDVGRWLRGAQDLRPDFVLLDPPRAGAGVDVVDAIADLAPRTVRYVACDPATLARDVRRFLERGYVLASITALDLFPQTWHVEVVAALELRP